LDETICLIHSELSEALEAYRDNHMLDEAWYEYEGVTRSKAWAINNNVSIDQLKPCGIPSELADTVIRICHYMGHTGATITLDDYFWERATNDRSVDTWTITFTELLAHCHLYVSSAYRFKDDGYEKKCKENLAYVAWRLFDYCENHNINLWAVIEEKGAFNRTRSVKHGGKKDMTAKRSITHAKIKTKPRKTEFTDIAEVLGIEPWRAACIFKRALTKFRSNWLVRYGTSPLM